MGERLQTSHPLTSSDKEVLRFIDKFNPARVTGGYVANNRLITAKRAHSLMLRGLAATEWFKSQNRLVVTPAGKAACATQNTSRH